MNEKRGTFRLSDLVVVSGPGRFRCSTCKADVRIEECAGRCPFCVLCSRFMVPVNEEIASS